MHRPYLQHLAATISPPESIRTNELKPRKPDAVVSAHVSPLDLGKAVLTSAR